MTTFRLADGTDLYYEEYGTGRPLVFLPGWAMTGVFFQKQIKDLSDTYRVILLDQRGQGQSTGKDSSLLTIDLMAKDLCEIIDGLKLHDVVIVGWSMGALVMWEYYEKYGDYKLAGLVVLEMAANLGAPDWAYEENGTLRENPERHLRSFIASMFVDIPSDPELNWMLSECMKTPVAVAEKLNLEIAYADARPVLPKIKVPTLIIFGRVLLFFTEEQEQETIRGIHNCKVVYFENSKHCPFWEEPARCNTEILNFVRTLPNS